MIVQGRYDMVCPIVSARRPASRLARGGVPRRPRRRALGVGARHPVRGHRRDGAVQVHGLVRVLMAASSGDIGSEAWLRARFSADAQPRPIASGDGHLWRDPGDIRPAAVLVPVVRHDDALTVLFTRRTPHLQDHAGQISFPGGRVEPDDALPRGGGAARSEGGGRARRGGRGVPRPAAGVRHRDRLSRHPGGRAGDAAARSASGSRSRSPRSSRSRSPSCSIPRTICATA